MVVEVEVEDGVLDGLVPLGDADAADELGIDLVHLCPLQVLPVLLVPLLLLWRYPCALGSIPVGAVIALGGRVAWAVGSRVAALVTVDFYNNGCVAAVVFLEEDGDADRVDSEIV